MKLDSYEVYHIGIKFNPVVNLDKLKKQLLDIMEKHGFAAKVVEERNAQGKIVAETLGTRNDTRVELRYERLALNTIGHTPQTVSGAFNAVTDMLPKLGYELNPSVDFFEVFSDVIIHSDTDPKKLMSSPFAKALKHLQDYGKMDVDGFRIMTEETPDQQGSLVLVIAPNPTSPSSKFLVRIFYRTIEKGLIVNFSNTIESKIIKVLQSLR